MATNPTLSTGSSGASVTQLQNFLNNAGYNVGKADGSFGNNTRAGVIAYQNANKLTADGTVGSNTWGKINGAKPSAPVTGTLAPKPAATPAPVAPAADPNKPTGLAQFNPLTGEQIKSQAESGINPLYNANVEANNQAAARNTLALDQQTAARQRLNQQQISESKTLFGQQRQIASDQSLSRGLARSSIATNSQDRVSANEATNMTSLQNSLQADVGAIEAQKTQLQGQLADSLKRLDIDKATQIKSEIDRLTQAQGDKQLQITQINNQFNSDQTAQKQAQTQFEATQKQAIVEFDWKKYMDGETLKLQQAAAARAAAGGGGGSGGGGTKAAGPDYYQPVYDEVFGAADPGRKWDDNKAVYLKNLPTATYKRLASEITNYVKDRKAFLAPAPAKNISQAPTGGNYWGTFR